MTLEEALHQMYQGKENVAKLAEQVGMPKTELQRVFRAFVDARPVWTLTFGRKTLNCLGRTSLDSFQ